MAVPEIIACPTTGLRESLSESISGLAENAAAAGHKPAVLISVDSSSDNAEKRGGATLSGIAAEFGFPAFSVFPAHRNPFFVNLEDLFEPELLEYACTSLAGYSSFGANLNMVLLATAGSRIISNDDDMFCRPGVREQHTQDVVFSNDYLPAELFKYPNRAVLIGAISECSVDIFTEHGRFLEENATDIDYTNSGTSIQNSGSILMCISGSYGDSGMKSARSFLSLEGLSRDELFSTSKSYNAHKLSKELIKIPNHSTVGQGTHCTAMHIALSNSQVLPPFLPAGRNQEGLFAVLLRICYPSSCTAFLNFGLYHNPEEVRAHTRKDLIEFHPTLAELIMAPAVSHRPSEEISASSDRMITLGKNLEELGSLRLSDFEMFLHEIWSRGINQYTERLERLLDKFQRQPDAWADDVDEHLEYVYQLLREPHLLFGKTGCGFSAEEVRYHTLMYGKLLQIWPDLHTKSAELNRESRGLAKQLPT